MNSSVPYIVPYDISELECEALMTLFLETASHIQNIRIEMVTNSGKQGGQEKHPATTLGLTVHKPTIRFASWLDREQRIDSIAHELFHILLVYRYGLRMIDRRIHHFGSSQDIFDYFLNLSKHWKYFLEQTVNTIHHQILVDYLKEAYRITSNLQLSLFRHNFRIVLKSYYPDKESQYAKGLIAFEYEKLVGGVENVINSNQQPEFFWIAYYSAQKHFGGYDLHAIPSPSGYEENVLSFLEDLGYKRRDFRFVPAKSSELSICTGKF
jgi:hypothetical protein